MDPNLFHLDWERLFEVLITIIVVAILLERALSLVFEHKLYLKKLNNLGLKEIITFGLASLVCIIWQFDAISMILVSDKTTIVGELISAAIISGGSKGSVKLFRDILNIKSTALRDIELAKNAEIKK